MAFLYPGIPLAGFHSTLVPLWPHHHQYRLMFLPHFLRTRGLLGSFSLSFFFPFMTLCSICFWSPISQKDRGHFPYSWGNRGSEGRLALWAKGGVRTNWRAVGLLSGTLCPGSLLSRQLHTGRLPGHTLCALIAFSSASRAYNFENDSFFQWLLLSVDRCFSFYHPEIQTENLLWTLLLSQFLSLSPLLLPPFSLREQTSIRVSCFHLLHSFHLLMPLYLAIWFSHQLPYILVEAIIPIDIPKHFIVKFSCCNLEGLHSCGHWKPLQVWTCSRFQKPS